MTRGRDGALDAQLRELRRGVVDVLPEDDFVTRLRTGQPLRVKLGVDPTAPDIHLGHTVVLSKLRQFQDFGHQAVLIIGDFTALIGDPSGRSATRPPLTREAVDANAQTYLDQVFKVLDRDRVEVRRNSEWLAPMALENVIRLASSMTVARLLERDDFKQRYRASTPIGLHELLYPLMQGYDSVVVRADVEIGGTDQTFNLMVGRDLQKNAAQPGQVAITLPLLEGLDGTQKMSKSLDNHIGVAEPARDVFGKVMSISDQLMVRYYELLGVGTVEEVARVRQGTVHPMQAKKFLAETLTARFHGPAAAREAAEFFEQRFQRKTAHQPDRIRLESVAEEVGILQLLKDVGFAPSTSEARRLVGQGAVRVDGERVGQNFRFRRGVHRLLEVGKRRLAEIEFVPRA